jgi:hypothetical protein
MHCDIYEDINADKPENNVTLPVTEGLSDKVHISRIGVDVDKIKGIPYT